MIVSANKDISITREECRRIKAMDHIGLEYLLTRLYKDGASHEAFQAEKKKIILKAREAIEKAINQKGIGPEKKAAIRKRYKELMEDV